MENVDEEFTKVLGTPTPGHDLFNRDTLGNDTFGNNTFGNYLLHGIEEVHLPDAVEWWPQTVGWGVLGLFLLLALAYYLVLQAKLWWRNRYRREAIARLTAIEGSATNWQAIVRELPFLLKTTALQAFPRRAVAQLSGQAWLDFLDAQYTGPAFSDTLGAALLQVAYQPEGQWDFFEEEATTLISMSRGWIVGHRPWDKEVSGD